MPRLPQQGVAGLVAVAVVDELEAIDVDEQHGARSRAAVCELLFQLPRELAPVDEAGERIVLRRVRQLQLGVLALRDVGEDALEAGPALRVDDPARLIAHPHDVPVGVQEAILVVEHARPLGLVLVDHDALAVIGVDAREPEVDVAHPLLGREAGHRLDLRAHVETAARLARLPAVGRNRHALDQRPEALFAEMLGGGVIHESRARARGTRLQALSATRPLLFKRRLYPASMRRLCVILGAWALLAACVVAARGRRDARRPRRRADRRALRPAPRPAPGGALRADERRRAARARRDARAPRRQPGCAPLR